MNGFVVTLTLLLVLGSGLVAGVFFAFSTFVMRALARIPPPHGIAAMQAINVTVINAWFLGAFVGTAGLCAVGVVVSLLRWSEPGSVYLLIGSVVYLIGTFVQTRVLHIPRNDALDALDPSESDSAAYWTRFLSEWTAANHIRTAAAAVSTVLFAVSLIG